MAVDGPIAVDASVAVKWLVKEELSDNALALYQGTIAVRFPILVPPHFGGEVTNAILWKLRSQDPAKHISESEARQAIQKLQDIIENNIKVVDAVKFYETALFFAFSQELPTVYDSLCVMLADQLGLELWTADRRLLTSVGSAAPWVRWIGDYPPS
jgi:predicted nucleic acid-binding protein